jgi:hypothetical protein
MQRDATRERIPDEMGSCQTAVFGFCRELLPPGTKMPVVRLLLTTRQLDRGGARRSRTMKR